MKNPPPHRRGRNPIYDFGAVKAGEPLIILCPYDAIYHRVSASIVYYNRTHVDYNEKHGKLVLRRSTDGCSVEVWRDDNVKKDL
jgi:hypothetical protein